MAGWDLTNAGDRRGGKSWYRLTTSVVGLALVAALSSCGHDSSPRAGEQVTVAVAGTALPAGAVSAEDIVTTGTGEPTSQVLTEGGGRLRWTVSPDGGRALHFPAYAASEQAPTAIVAVSSESSDWLDPDGRALRFGADVSIDATSSGTEHDNGDNVLQRGLFVDPAQFKLQTDHHRASCLVRGSKGSGLAESTVTMRPGEWYRLACTQDEDAVEITVSRLVDGRPVDTTSVRVPAEVGDVDFPVRTPLAVGGKIAADGSPAHATDQFNGSVGRVYVNVGPVS